MKILALEFSSPHRSAALVDGGQLLAEVRESGPRELGPVAMIDTVLRSAEVERGQIEAMAVGLGPGSYAGIRSAIALAQGWEAARSVALMGVNSMDALALHMQSRGFRGELAVVVDAHRREFYVGRYRVESDTRMLLEPIRIVAEAELRELTAGCSLVVSPDRSPRGIQAERMLPEASAIARLALENGERHPGRELEPIYLREVKFVKAPPPRVIPDE